MNQLILMFAVCLVVLSGCSGHTTLGKEDGTTFRSYYTSNLFAPSAVVLTMTKDGETKVIGFASDKATLNTLGPAAVQAVGFTAAANTYGANLKPDTVNVGGGNATSGNLTGGNVTDESTDIPPSPQLPEPCNR